ncbi:uncharacterized protein LOC103505697 [Diaphorina citri]|uniref:Uncharacterized protein LOC103505697 n=1 Tax=Diaphorina citri TaxID=121845 RepID=A0A1S3CW69_DIACI|nr:uncharacterized protein LOC103505697 [Diaphorina citri]
MILYFTEPSLSDIQLPPKVVKQDDDLDFDETNIHVQKDIKIGGNVVAKIFFALVFGALICMVGLIVFEHRGTGNEGNPSVFAVKFGVGVALIVVAHVVLVSKWKANVDTGELPKLHFP